MRVVCSRLGVLLGAGQRGLLSAQRCERWISTSRAAALRLPTSSASVAHEKQASPLSTVERGTRYEEHVLAYLEHALPGMQLARVGGASDGGIDITGWWRLPTQGAWPSSPSKSGGDDDKAGSQTGLRLPARIRVMVQCKAEAKKLGPIHIRELQGTYASRFSIRNQAGGQESSSDDTEDQNSSGGGARHASIAAMGVLASASGFSKQCVVQALACPVPLLLVHLVPPLEARAVGATSARPSLQPLSLLANDALQSSLLKDTLHVKWAVHPPASSSAAARSQSRGGAGAVPQLTPSLVFSYPG